MDLSTVETKLKSNSYANVDMFVSDVRLIFQNCYTFNGVEHAVSQLAKRLEEIFEKQLKQMPPAEEVRSSLSVS